MIINLDNIRKIEKCMFSKRKEISWNFRQTGTTKNKNINAQEQLLITKELRKNMLWSKLKNSFNKDRSYENWCKYKQQSNFCVNLLRLTKWNFFKQLNKKKTSNSRTFWKEIKPYFNDKGGISSKICKH